MAHLPAPACAAVSEDGAEPPHEPDYAYAVALTQRCHEERIAATRAKIDAAIAELIDAVLERADFEV